MPQEIKKRFLSPPAEARPMYYVTLPDPRDPAAETVAAEELARCKQSGCGVLIPQLPEDIEFDREQLAATRALYAFLLREAEKAGLGVGFYLDPAFERAVIRTMSDIDDVSLHAQTLICHETICTRGETLKKRLHAGALMSLVAFSEDDLTILDLRAYVKEGELCWQVPDGNFVVREYLSVPDEERLGANYLSYEAARGYVEAVFSLFADILAPYAGKTLRVLAYAGVGFLGRNRRAWDPSFNTRFRAAYGFDPAPYYPVLFGYVGKRTEHLRSLFMSTRAELLQNGILRAIADVAAEAHLVPFGSLTEPKLTAPSFTVGDTMLDGRILPCALYDKAYMYGSNSAKVAAGAAYNFDIPAVNAELFRAYTVKDRAHLTRDAMNAFARGVNRTAIHLPHSMSEDAAFGDFAARVQSMLYGGAHVADIALLYPIYHLHSKATLYDCPANGYEYPTTPETADYMTLMNSVTIYAGHDLTLLHPEALAARCRVEGNTLILDNAQNREQFRIVMLPGAEMIRLDNLRLLKKFFDGGGKLIATGVLPHMAFEPDETGDNDREVQRIVRQIFGHDACDRRVIRDYCHNRNERGGEAYFLYFNRSAVDGTQMTTSTTVNEALEALALPFDVYLPAMPRLESTGALNAIYPEFKRIGLHLSFPGGGMLDHIHKRFGDTDVYYFSNTTAEDYNHHVLLRGALAVEEWDPQTGETRERHAKFLSYRGMIYTDLRLTLPADTSLFFVGKPVEKKEIKEVTPITSIERLRSEHAALMSEF